MELHQPYLQQRQAPISIAIVFRDVRALQTGPLLSKRLEDRLRTRPAEGAGVLASLPGASPVGTKGVVPLTGVDADLVI